MRNIPSTTTTATAISASTTIRTIKRHNYIATICSRGIVFWIYVFQFRAYYCLSVARPTTIIDRHLEQYFTILQLQSSKFSSMEDSYVITNRKRSANCNFDDNREPVLEESSSSSADHQKRMKLMPTIRDFSTMLSLFDTSLSFAQRKETAIQNIQTYTKAMQERYQQMIPFTNETEITIILHSLQNVIPISTTATTTSTTCNDVDHHEAVHDDVDDDDKSMNKMLQELQDRILPHFAHVSHKNWTMTGENAQQWHTYLFPYSKSPNHIASQFQSQQRHMFERIYREGNWDAAVLHQQQQSQNAINSNNVNKAAIPKLKPWAVLVTVRNEIP